MTEPASRIKAADPAVLPLTLYRLTLETDDKDCFDFLRNIFIGVESLTDDFEVDRMGQAIRKVIGVEARVRERLTR